MPMSQQNSRALVRGPNPSFPHLIASLKEGPEGADLQIQRWQRKVGPHCLSLPPQLTCTKDNMDPHVPSTRAHPDAHF